MKSVLRRSHAEDPVDHCNKVWTVVFFLFLALITWIVPLATDFNSSEKPSSMPQAKQQEELEFSTVCWTPREMTSAHVNYMNTYCGNAFNDMINNRENPVKLYEVREDMPFPRTRPDPVDSKRFVEDLLRNFTKGSTDDVSKKALTDNTQKTDDNKDNVYKFPLALFLVAVLLRVPYLLSKLMSGCFGLLNIDLVLSSAVQAQSSEESCRRHAIEGLAKGAMDDVKRSPRALTGLYILVKLLCCIILICALVGVQEIAVTEESESMTNADDTPVVNERKNATIHPLARKILMCDVPIRQLQSIQRYTLQCVFTRKAKLEINVAPPTVPDETDDRGATLKFFEILSYVIFIYLIILLVANVFSLLALACRICCNQWQPAASKVAGSSTVPLDYRLLLLFSHDNAGPLVTLGLAQNVSGIHGSESPPEKQPLDIGETEMVA